MPERFVPADRRTAAIAAGLGALGVALGAFGAHGLKSMTDAAGLATWQTGAHYHQLHAVVLLVLGLLTPPTGAWRSAKGCFLAGVLVFSGSLYLLVLTPWRWMGAIAPLGGTLLILGWIFTILAIGKESQLS